MRRKRLHILYLLHDSFHHTRYHESSTDIFSTFADGLEDALPALFKIAAQFRPEMYSQHHQRLSDLLDLWEDELLFDPPYHKRLRHAVDEGIKQSESHTGPELKPTEVRFQDENHIPYILPPSHGDSTTPFYDLPAGNMIPHVIPNSTQPIDNQLIKPLQLTAGPANESLVRAVKEVLNDIESSDYLSPEDEGQGTPDKDLIGQTIVSNNDLGRTCQTEGYYGWSRGFCEKMRSGEGVGFLVTMDGAIEVGQKRYDERKTRRASSFEASDTSSRSTSPARSKTSSQERFGQRDSLSRSYSPELYSPASGQNTVSTDLERARGRSPPYDPRRPRPSSHQVPMLAQSFVGDPPSVPQIPGCSPMKTATPPRPPNYDGPWPPPPPPSAPHHPVMPINGYSNLSSQAAPQSITWTPQNTERLRQSAPSGPALYRTNG